MLGLVNDTREGEGLVPLRLGANTAAQAHAEASLVGGINSHWDLAGLKPAMRYSLAGGYQRNQENVFRNRCRGGCSFSLREQIREIMMVWMSSPDHRREILRPNHRMVNIGLAWQHDFFRGSYVFNVVQQFEGDYVQYETLPTIGDDGRIALAGTLRNGATLHEARDLSIQVYYDPPPQPVTVGQIDRVYGSNPGLYVAKLRRPLSDGRHYTMETGEVTNELRPAPYDFPLDSPPCWDDWDECRALDWEARAAPTTAVTSTRHRITAARWNTTATSFDVVADFSPVLDQYGAGVYQVDLRAILNGEEVLVSEYAVFYGASAPGG